MAKIYYDLIKKELRTINDVPLRWKADVEAMLNDE